MNEVVWENLCTLNEIELGGIEGGVNVADIAAAVGGVYSTVVSAVQFAGSVGWLATTSTAVVICTNPIVAGTAVVAGLLTAGYGIYLLFKK